MQILGFNSAFWVHLHLQKVLSICFDDLIEIIRAKKLLNKEALNTVLGMDWNKRYVIMTRTLVRIRISTRFDPSVTSNSIYRREFNRPSILIDVVV